MSVLVSDFVEFGTVLASSIVIVIMYVAHCH